jgi:hypothetical protein
VVTDGLQAGERVVTTNQYRLQPGSPVHALAPANSAAGPQQQPEQPAPDAASQASKVAPRQTS